MNLIDENVERALITGSELVRSQAKANVTAAGRVDTGRLRDDINYKLVKDEHYTGGMASQIGSPEEYAIYNEFGTGEFAENGAGRKGGWFYHDPDGTPHFTKGLTPIKFMRNAFRDTKQEVQSVYQQELGKGMK